MSPMERIGEADLNAYLDGELDAEARIAVEAWLNDNPDEAARLAAAFVGKLHRLHHLADHAVGADHDGVAIFLRQFEGQDR